MEKIIITTFMDLRMFFLRSLYCNIYLQEKNRSRNLWRTSPSRSDFFTTLRYLVVVFLNEDKFCLISCFLILVWSCWETLGRNFYKSQA